MFTMPRRGIVNVKMVITEEKILSNIDKVKKLINPNSKRQIIELEDDSYFKDLVESIKTYLIEYPKKKNFPKSIYDAAYELVEYATNLFEENTKQIERLIKQREYNIKTAAILKQTLAIIQSGDEEWKRAISDVSNRLPEDVIQALIIVGKYQRAQTQEFQSAMRLISAKIVNLESNLHIEIDMERVEDKSKALSYIGIEVADALKLIPVPVETNTANAQANTPAQNTSVVVNTLDQSEQGQAYQNYYSETRQEVKESFWNKIKNSKIVRAFKYAFRIRITLSLPEGLPSGNNNNNN
ncbi:MAG: hypothetical protein IKG56_05175 [Clostridia bacterium]|nr:hypothetical protein [Clostridia bacterium]